MSKMRFGSNSVVPVKDLRYPYSAGNGIDQDLLLQNTISVDSTVIRNISSMDAASGNVCTQYGMTVNGNQLTAFGRYTKVIGDGATAYGNSAQANAAYTTAIGRRAHADNRNSVALGNEATAHDIETIAIGDNSHANFYGSIAIGNEVVTGNSKSSIVIGHKSKAFNNNDTYPSIIIGNEIDLSDTMSQGSIVIGGMKKINDNDEQTINERRTVGQFSVAIGYNAGGERNQIAHDIVAIGGEARTKYQHSVAIGYGAKAFGNGNIAIGTDNETISYSWNGGNSDFANTSIGFESKISGYRSVIIGPWNNANGDSNIVLGHRIQVGTGTSESTGTANENIVIGSYGGTYGNYNIQLGNGFINGDNTFQVWDYKLLDRINGIIPKERFSAYIPLNGQVLYYDSSLGALAWKDVGQGGGGGGTYTLPVASKTVLGGVKIGTGLNITTDGILSVQSSQQDVTWGSIKGKLRNQTDLQNALDAKQKVMQYTTMPTATSNRNGEVAQYIGEEDAVYKPGQFYQCTLDDYPTATITSDTQWANLEVDAWMFANFVSKYFYNNDLSALPSKIYEIEYVNQYDGLGWLLVENESAMYVKDIYKMGVIAEGGEPSIGDKVYVQLYMHGATGYAWRKLLVDAQVSVNNTLTSTSTKQALSANMGRVLNDKIQELSGISHFLAMWDTDTGIARYLNSGYRYESGDYFIIASVAPASATLEPTYTPTGSGSVHNIQVVDITDWEAEYGTTTQTVHFTYNSSNLWEDNDGRQYDMQDLGIIFEGAAAINDKITVVYTSTTNYKPAGAIYPGDTPTSREVTTDPVQISDMYFYDGTHWIFLPSSSRQIAVDEQLDNNSRNPVENRVVTGALDTKLDIDTTEGIYATDENEDTVKLAIGAGLAVENGELINTRTGGTWGQITGDIEDQTDLVDYVASHGGSGSSLQLADVFIKSKNLCEKDGIDEWEMERYKGNYSDIFFKISSDYNTLKGMKNDLYVTISRNANTNCARRISKMTVLDDCNRFKTNKKFYCWRSLASGWGTYDYDENEGEWRWLENTPKRTEYIYFYVEEDYDNQSEMINDNPVIFTIPTYNETLDKGGWGTSFNELYNWGSLEDYDDPDYERCPQYDIDTVISLNSNFSSENVSPEYGYGNVVKNEFIKMECRIYSGNDGKFYLWCGDWTDSLANVYVAAEYNGDEHIPVPNEVPKFMGDLMDWTDVTTLESQFTFVERRSDLDYYKYDGSKTDFRTVVEKLRVSTQDFPDQEDSVGQFDTNWNSYWLDYPIKPVRLADCKIYAYKLPKTFGDTQEEQTARSQKFVSLIKRAWSFEEIEADEDLKYLIMNQDDLIFVLPYDTSYIWMRLFGWQKGVYYRKGDENSGKNGTYAEPWDRHDLTMAIRKTQNPFNCCNIKMYGARRTDWGDERGRFFQRLQFNLTTGSDLSQCKLSQLHPITKILWINGSQCKITQGLIDQSK